MVVMVLLAPLVLLGLLGHRASKACKAQQGLLVPMAQMAPASPSPAPWPMPVPCQGGLVLLMRVTATSPKMMGISMSGAVLPSLTQERYEDHKASQVPQEHKASKARLVLTVLTAKTVLLAHRVP